MVDINGEQRDVTPDDLKIAIIRNQVQVVNLKLTSNNRLIDKDVDKQLTDNTIMPNKVVRPNNIKDRSDHFYRMENIMSKLAHSLINCLSTAGYRVITNLSDDETLLCKKIYKIFGNIYLPLDTITVSLEKTHKNSYIFTLALYNQAKNEEIQKQRLILSELGSYGLLYEANQFMQQWIEAVKMK